MQSFGEKIQQKTSFILHFHKWTCSSFWNTYIKSILLWIRHTKCNFSKTSLALIYCEHYFHPPQITFVQTLEASLILWLEPNFEIFQCGKGIYLAENKTRIISSFPRDCQGELSFLSGIKNRIIPSVIFLILNRASRSSTKESKICILIIKVKYIPKGSKQI